MRVIHAQKYNEERDSLSRDWFTFLSRFDITPYWLVKLEAHLLDGSASVTDDENPAGWWQGFAVRTTFFF